MARTNIVALPGDGVGKEVTKAGLEVLEALQEAYGFDIEVEEVQCGAQYWQETGNEWQEGGLERCAEADGILLGAVGWPGAVLPNSDIAGTGVVFGLRFGLDLYANVRPCKLYPGVPHKVSDRFTQIWAPETVDMLILRENTEGSYTPTKGFLDRGGVKEVAVDSRVITRKGALRIHEKAFAYAERRKAEREALGIEREAKVTCVDKSNVRAGCRLFRGVYDEVADRHPTITRDYAYVDAFTQWLVRNPEWFDVAVAPNMLGDIVTDLAAVLQGGMGMAASGNIGDKHAMFEPVHGSAPKHAGKDMVNPYAMVQCVGMMLDHVGTARGEQRMLDAAQGLEAAMASCLNDRIFTYDLGGDYKCSHVGTAVAKAVKQVQATA